MRTYYPYFQLFAGVESKTIHLVPRPPPRPNAEPNPPSSSTGNGESDPSMAGMAERAAAVLAHGFMSSFRNAGQAPE